MHRDPAFIWETEALRSGRGAAATVVERPPAGDGEAWRTLRETHEATGIPIDTLRKWVRRGTVPSFLDLRYGDGLRMVSMEAVLARADELGREVTPVLDVSPLPPPAPTRPVVEEPPPGTMIVPLAAWDKILVQLGNLHEAGQQLAEAKERAARAETEARFLRERLADLRAEMARAKGEHADAETAPRGPSAPPRRSTWRAVSRSFYDSWRHRRRR